MRHFSKISSFLIAVISPLATEIIGRFQAIKTDVLLIFSFITGTEFLSPMIFSNEYITEF